MHTVYYLKCILDTIFYVNCVYKQCLSLIKCCNSRHFIYNIHFAITVKLIIYKLIYYKVKSPATTVKHFTIDSLKYKIDVYIV